MSSTEKTARTMPPRQRGFTLVELIVVIAVIVILLVVLVPGVNNAREAARRTQCRGNLKQIGAALLNYHETYRKFPSGWIASDLAPESGMFLGWQTMLLPYIDRADIFSSIVLNSPPTEQAQLPSATLEKLGEQTISAFQCPSDPTPNLNPLRSGFAKSNYSGIFGSQALPRLLPDRMGSWMPGSAPTPKSGNGMFHANSGVGQRGISDGSSNTIIVGERGISSAAGIWLGVVANQFENDQITDCGFRSRINRSYSALSSVHPGGVNVLMADGSSRFLNNNLDVSPGSVKTGVFESLCAKSDENDKLKDAEL